LFKAAGRLLASGFILAFAVKNRQKVLTSSFFYDILLSIKKAMTKSDCL